MDNTADITRLYNAEGIHRNEADDLRRKASERGHGSQAGRRFLRLALDVDRQAEHCLRLRRNLLA